MKKKNFLADLIKKIEYYLPMSFGSFLLFCFTLYLFFSVGKSIVGSYNSNKDMEKEEAKIAKLEEDVAYLKNQINYYQTYSYKEKEAREKLNYIAPGENVIALPYDKDEDKTPDQELQEIKVKTSNCSKWWDYYFK